MLKLMKYELRKQMFSKIILLVILAILECVFLFGVITYDENIFGTAIGIFSLVAFGAILYVSFEAILTYSSDLKTKQSYMLFLTPNSTYSIVGAKLITSIIQVLLTGAVFIGIIVLNVFLLAIRMNEIDEMLQMIRRGLEQLMGAHIELSYLFAAIFYALFSWISIISIAMLSITISTTLLANSKLKGLLSVIIFFSLNAIIFKIYAYIFESITWKVSDFYAVDACVLVVVLLSYFATAWMLDKKVSV